jgi:hypothetical protein
MLPVLQVRAVGLTFRGGQTIATRAKAAAAVVRLQMLKQTKYNTDILGD